MLIDDLVEYCDEQYQSGECGACTGKDRCVNECDGNCKLCLDDIHFHEQQRRTQYDCERLLYYYVCRYSYKYCSEMIYALRQIDLSDYPYFHILSMGCGGAPDLMAFQYMIIINDVDSINTGRDAFPIFVEEIERDGLTVNRELRRRFKSVNHFANSVQYASKKNIFDGITDDFQKDYCVALSCESAQLILEVY